MTLIPTYLVVVIYTHQLNIKAYMSDWYNPYNYKDKNHTGNSLLSSSMIFGGYTSLTCKTSYNFYYISYMNQLNLIDNNQDI